MRQTIIEGLSNKQDYNSWQDFTKKNKDCEKSSGNDFVAQLCTIG